MPKVTQTIPRPPYPIEPVRVGSYPSYHALWHLERMKIVDDLVSFRSAPWRLAANCLDKIGDCKTTPTRVALIDTQVEHTHPNLRDAVDQVLMLDLTAGPLGYHTVKFDCLGTTLQADRIALMQKAASAAPHATTDLTKRLFEHIGSQDAGRKGVDEKPASAHGTAMAGLIGARPASAMAHRPGSLSPELKPAGTIPVELPYIGVDPFCEIVPIVTNTAPDPIQTKLALAYAELIEADIIVFSATLSDPTKRVTGYGDLHDPSGNTGTSDPEPGHTTVVDSAKGLLQDAGAKIADVPSELLPEWEDLERQFVDLSMRIPILCAAGNSDDGLLSYPARLWTKENGIVAVGARTSWNLRASYSAGDRDGMQVTVFSYSGDSEELDRGTDGKNSIRLDPYAAAFGPDAIKFLEIYDVTETNNNKAVEDLISTDLPGPGGYNPSDIMKDKANSDAIYDIPSYYCRFSGTSGATAVLAGLLSLMAAAGKLDFTNFIDFKETKLMDLNGYSKVTGDPVASWSRLTS